MTPLLITARLGRPGSRVTKITPVFTGRVDGPCLPVVCTGDRERTAREHPLVHGRWFFDEQERYLAPETSVQTSMQSS